MKSENDSSLNGCEKVRLCAMVFVDDKMQKKTLKFWSKHLLSFLCHTRYTKVTTKNEC